MPKKQDVRIDRIVFKYVVIVIGCVFYAIGFQFFLYPNNITSGGVVGTAMIINQLTGLPVGVLTIVMNVPLFLVAWRHFGLDFMIGSLVGMGLSSVLVDVFAEFGIVLTNDAMLAAVIGGVIKGVGLGMIYYVGGTTGGIDIVVKIMRRRLASVNFGTIMLALDTVVITAYAMVLGRAPCTPSSPCTSSPRWWIWCSTALTTPASATSSATGTRTSPMRSSTARCTAA